MQQKTMIKLVAGVCEVTRDRAATALDVLFDEWGAALARGEILHLPGIGGLSLAPTKGGAGRNPRTGEAITILPGHRGRFRPAARLKERALRRVPAHRQAAE